MKLLPFVALFMASVSAAPETATAKLPIPWGGVCACEWRSPGVFWLGKRDFVRCAMDATRAAVSTGAITPPEARGAIRVARRGPCGKRSYARQATCGGPRGRACSARDTVCSFIGTACSPGRWGYCENRGCSDGGDPRPVCGCDGKTYGHSCLAFEAGVEVAHFGSCEAGQVTRRPVWRSTTASPPGRSASCMPKVPT